MHPARIPLTPQTDERNFPVWEGPKAPPGHSGHPYPKMLIRAFPKEERASWLEKHKRHDRMDGDYWEERCPKVGDPVPYEATQELVDAGLANTVGEPLIANTPAEEELIYRAMGLRGPPPRLRWSISRLRPNLLTRPTAQWPTSKRKMRGFANSSPKAASQPSGNIPAARRSA